MSKNPSQPEKDAKLIVAGLQTPFGEHLTEWLGLQYNALHQGAETAGLTSDQIAFSVQQAVGVKLVIDHLMSQQALLDGGYFDKD